MRRRDAVNAHLVLEGLALLGCLALGACVVPFPW